ncbi:Oidioi.mRNA.OKI2018_I69.PAR.g9526.t1.cds [Oikopleura dioica]|uniref:Oidioi.mRNA.OKI2018_I69.PAR.g9526.t1.cds n=1 Tax=Oikopleura dioica TaxID=34765 RepID=A0ABN7RLB4_OIKDI|nr:Oidioi.mRNA.OKI2018_I69.PAR.g9526.t1.cds [Oikopleura dioica]
MILLTMTVLSLIAGTIFYIFTKDQSLEVDETIELNFDNFTKLAETITLEIGNKEYDAFLIEDGSFEDVKTECEEKGGKLAWNKATSKDGLFEKSHWIELGNDTKFDDANLNETFEKFMAPMDKKEVQIIMSKYLSRFNHSCMILRRPPPVLVPISLNPREFICRDDVLDDLGRVKIVDSNVSPDCEYLQLNQSFVEKHQLWDQNFKNKTWIDFRSPLTVKGLHIGSNFTEDIEDQTGFSWCPGQPELPAGISWTSNLIYKPDEHKRWYRLAYSGSKFAGVCILRLKN